MAVYESYYNSTEIIFKMQDKTPKQIDNAIENNTIQTFTFSYALPLNAFTHVVLSYDKSERKCTCTSTAWNRELELLYQMQITKKVRKQ